MSRTILLLSALLLLSSCQAKRARVVVDKTLAGLTGGKQVFKEDFNAGLERWNNTSKNFRLVKGRLYSGDRPNNNAGIWLKDFQLPTNFRVEFDARSVKGNNKVFEGDIKFELGGTKQEHLSGYILIFGGWKNSLNTIARQEEHTERMAVDTKTKVIEDKVHKIAFIRLGNDLKWFVDGQLMLTATDPNVLTGGVFGFNNWNSRYYIDNLTIFEL